MKTLKILSCGIVAFIIPITTNAYNYTLGSNYNQVQDGDWILFCNGSSHCYTCSDISTEISDNLTIVTDEQTVRWNNATYLCVEELGYWVNFGNTTVPAKGTCSKNQVWKSLGSNKYCTYTQSGTWKRYINATGLECNSGMASYSACPGGCVELNTCNTFTHCGTGYYKNGNSCEACPYANGNLTRGTTAGYTNIGITACYLTNGATGQDTTGKWKIVDPTNQHCPYK